MCLDSLFRIPSISLNYALYYRKNIRVDGFKIVKLKTLLVPDWFHTLKRAKFGKCAIDLPKKEHSITSLTSILKIIDIYKKQTKQRLKSTNLMHALVTVSMLLTGLHP